MTDKQIVLTMILEHKFASLSNKVKNLPYVFSEIRKIKKVMSRLGNQDAVKFRKLFELANEAYTSSQRRFKVEAEYSVTYLLKLFLEKHTELVKLLKLNQKKLDKLFNRIEAGYSFNSLRVVNSISESVEIALVQYNYRSSK